MNRGFMDRSGVVLPLLLICLLALTALATVAIHAARQEIIIADAATRLLQARLSAEGGIRQAGGVVTSDRLLALRERAPEDVLERATPTMGSVVVRGHRLPADFVLFEGVGSPSGGRGGEVRLGRLVWVLDPHRIVSSFSSTLVHGGSLTLSGGMVDGGEVARAPEDWPTQVCSGHWAALDSIFPPGGMAASTIARPDDPSPTDLGNLDLPHLLALADLVAEGSLTPRPILDAGACLAGDSANWGAPSSPEGSCGPLVRLVISPTSLHLASGEGQGVLVVAGNLDLTDGMRLSGIVLVGGNLRLAGESRIDGLVRVGGDVRIEGGSEVSGSGCAALRALESPVFQRSFPVSDGSWVGGF